jgi:hypothetical protein
MIGPLRLRAEKTRFLYFSSRALRRHDIASLSQRLASGT